MKITRINWIKRLSKIVLTLGMLASSPAIMAQEQLAYKEIPGIDVQNYAIELWTPTMTAGDLTAKVEITLTAMQDLNAIYLNAESQSLSVYAIHVNGQSTDFENIQGLQAVQNHFLSSNLLKIDHALAAGQGANITIEYFIRSNQYSHDRGMIFEDDYHGAAVFITRNWPYYARYWLPSHDHPSDNATYDYRLHVPAGNFGLANGKLIGGNYDMGSGLDADGLAVYEWRQESPIPTYGVNITIGDFEKYESEICYKENGTVHAEQSSCQEASYRVPVVLFVPEQHEQKTEFLSELEKAKNSLIFYATMLGKFEYAKLGFVVAPHPFSMESNSLIVLTEPYAAVHEVSHHWWGNNVLIDHWGEFWVSEGYTTYYTWLYEEFINSGETLDDHYIYDTEQVISHDDNADPVTLYEEDPDWTPYSGGAACVHDLRARVESFLLGGDANPEQGELATLRLVFYEYQRGLYNQFKFKTLGRESLKDFSLNHLYKFYKNAGYALSHDQAKVLIDEWYDFWLLRE